MSWSVPKTNWKAGNVPTPADFNRIEENIRLLGQGGRAPSSDLAANEKLDIGSTDDTFLITGSAFIKYISTAGRGAGNKICLVSKDGNTFMSNQSSPPTGYAALKICKIGTGVENGLVADIDTVLFFVFDGSKWLLTY